MPDQQQDYPFPTCQLVSMYICNQTLLSLPGSLYSNTSTKEGETFGHGHVEETAGLAEVTEWKSAVSLGHCKHSEVIFL